MLNAPLDVAVPKPVMIDTEPPRPLAEFVASPAWMVTRPPPAAAPAPTSRLTLPPVPLVASPDFRITCPLLPFSDTRLPW